MKNLFKFLVFFSVCSCAIAQEDTAYGVVDPGASGIIYRTVKTITRKAVPGVDYAAASHTHGPGDINQSSTNRFATDAEKATWNSKAAGTHTHAATDVIQDATHRMVTDAQIQDWNDDQVGSGGSSAIKLHNDVAYASSIILNFNSTGDYNITNITGNFTLTQINGSDGKHLDIIFRKVTGGTVVMNIDPTTFASPSYSTPSTIAKVDKNAHTITLTGPSGAVYSMVITYLKEIPEIVIKNLPDSENANPRVVTDQTWDAYGPVIPNPHNTTENVLYTFVLQPGQLTGRSKLILECHIKAAFSGNIAGAQLKIRANGTIIEDMGIYPNAGSLGRRQVVIMNGSVLSQSFFKGYSEVSNRVATETTTSIDFSAPVTITYSLQQTNGADTYGLGSFSIRGEALGL